MPKPRPLRAYLFRPTVRRDDVSAIDGVAVVLARDSREARRLISRATPDCEWSLHYPRASVPATAPAVVEHYWARYRPIWEA